MANEALAAALKAADPQAEVHFSDYLAYLNWIQRGVVQWPYLAWLRWYPSGYRWFYRWTNRPGEPQVITNSFSWAGAARMERDLARLRPNLVVSSFIAPVSLAGAVRERRSKSFFNALIVTDYEAHRHWARPEADLFLVATDQVKSELVALGMDAAKIAVTGIPISPRYADLAQHKETKAELRLRLGLEPDIPVILLSAGAKGIYHSYDRVVDLLSHLPLPVQVLLLAGSEASAGPVQTGPVRLHRYGFTELFPEFLAASDLVLGKAGGLTVSEACSLGIPMLIYDPIPGQEEGNAAFLEKVGAAIWPRNLPTLRAQLLALLGSPERLVQMAEAARSLGRPQAASEAAKLLVVAVEGLSSQKTPQRILEGGV